MKKYLISILYMILKDLESFSCNLNLLPITDNRVVNKIVVYEI